MAIYLKLLWTIRKLVGLMNALIAAVIAYGFWLFLSRDGMIDGWGWLMTIPTLALLLIAPPLLTSLAIFTDSSRKLKIAFLMLNVLILVFLICGIFADHWIAASADRPFSIRSFSRMSLILSTPFLINVMTLLALLLPKKVLPSVGIPPA